MDYQNDYVPTWKVTHIDTIKEEAHWNYIFEEPPYWLQITEPEQIIPEYIQSQIIEEQSKVSPHLLWLTYYTHTASAHGPHGRHMRLQPQNHSGDWVHRYDHAPRQGPCKAIFTAEGSTMVLEPQNIEDKDIEKLRDIKIQ